MFKSKLFSPEITVAAVIEKEKKFLIVEEKADNNIVLNQPAGHLESDETLIAAVMRETKEETGATFEPTALVGVYFYTSLQSTTYLRFCFTGIATTFDQQQPLDIGIIRTHWLTRNELAQQAVKLRSPMVLRCIDDYLAQQRFPLHLINDLRAL